MNKENSGLARTTLEIAKYEELAGHGVCVQQPSDGKTLYGRKRDPDIHCIHSQMSPESYFDRKPKALWCHGEPLSSVGNGISMKAVVDLAAKSDCFICMRKDEMPIWQSIKRTYLIDKGVDLDFYFPMAGQEKLSGEPAILYCENWRRERNPLYLCVAMEEIWKKFPKARLHLYNCNDEKMRSTFDALIKQNKWWVWLGSLKGSVDIKEITQLYNRADIVVSCLFPLYARSIEAFACGKAFIGPGYKEHEYPWQCDLDPHSIAHAVVKCWENYDQVNYREWAEKHHDVKESVKQAIDVYNRYL